MGKTRSEAKTKPRPLTEVFQDWLEKADRIGAYLEYQIDGANADQGGERLARLLEEMMPPVMSTCARQEPSERWISLHMSAQPGQLLLECASAGRYRLESGRTPEGVSSIKLVQYGDSYRLQVEIRA